LLEGHIVRVVEVPAINVRRVAVPERRALVYAGDSGPKEV
jgi:hypothetical protein